MTAPKLFLAIVVIIIVGGVLLALVGGRRGDAGVIKNLNTIRTAAELYYDMNKNYGTAFVGSCPDAGAGTIFKDDKSVKIALKGALSAGGGEGDCVVTDGPSQVWAVRVQLKSRSEYWCVDSTGATAKTGSAINGAGACVFP
jgi:hypothetical protein